MAKNIESELDKTQSELHFEKLRHFPIMPFNIDETNTKYKE
jgi:hypothetical protein